MGNIAGGIVLVILIWIALQAIIAFLSFIFSSINDSYYSAAYWSKRVAKRESEQSAPKP